MREMLPFNVVLQTRTCIQPSTVIRDQLERPRVIPGPIGQKGAVAAEQGAAVALFIDFTHPYVELKTSCTVAPSLHARIQSVQSMHFEWRQSKGRSGWFSLATSINKLGLTRASVGVLPSQTVSRKDDMKRTASITVTVREPTTGSCSVFRHRSECTYIRDRAYYLRVPSAGYNSPTIRLLYKYGQSKRT